MTGTRAAESGKKAPRVVRVWIDMAPNSEYLQSIYKGDLGVPHQLLFTFRQGGGLFGAEANDGVVSVASQLRPAAQEQAVRIEGFNETHMGVLESKEVAQRAQRPAGETRAISPRIRRRLDLRAGRARSSRLVALVPSSRRVSSTHRPARAEIQRRLDAALGGRITWQALEVRLLPAPHGELRQVRIDIPDTLAADAERVQVYLRIWPLLRGRPEIASVTLDKPRIRIAAARRKRMREEGGARHHGGLPRRRRAPGARAAAVRRRNHAQAEAAPSWRDRFALQQRERQARAAARPASTWSSKPTTRSGSGCASRRGSTMPIFRRRSARASTMSTSLPRWRSPASPSARSRAAFPPMPCCRSTPPGAAEIEISRSSAALQIAELPWQLTLQSAQIGVSEKQVSVKRARGALGESTFTDVAAQVELAGAPRLSAGSGRATLADQLLKWALEKAGAPPELELKAPVQVAARRITWNQAAGLGVEADLGVDGGPSIGVALGWKPERFELRRLVIKDAQSDATLSAVMGKDFFQAGFSGVLHAQSVASLRRKPEPRTGRVQGELRLAFDRARAAAEQRRRQARNRGARPERARGQAGARRARRPRRRGWRAADRPRARRDRRAGWSS